MRHLRVDWLVVIVMLFTLAITGCNTGDAPVYSRFVNISPEGWAEDEYCEYATAEQDSTLFASASERYDVMVAVRYTDIYPYSDLYLSLATTPESVLACEHRVRLADDEGLLLGHGTHGVQLVADTIARSITLPQLLNVRISQAMHRPLLPGIMEVGLIISRSKIF